MPNPSPSGVLEKLTRELRALMDLYSAFTGGPPRPPQTDGQRKNEENWDRHFEKQREQARLGELAAKAGKTGVYGYRLKEDPETHFRGEVPADSWQEAKAALVGRGLPRASLRIQRIYPKD